MTNIDPIKREQADDYNTYRPRWRLPLIVVGSIFGIALWLWLAHFVG